MSISPLILTPLHNAAKILSFPTGLEVHFEDIFKSNKFFFKFLSWAEISGTSVSKLDHQMSRIWIEVAGPLPLLETANKFGWLKTGVPDISAQDRN